MARRDTPLIVAMRLRDSKTLSRVFFEIEFDHHGGLVTHHPAVVTRLDRHGLRRGEFDNAPVLVLNVDLSVRQKSNVRVLTEATADDRLHVRGPAKARRIDHAFDAARARANNVDVYTRDRAVLRIGHGREQRIGRIHTV